MALTPKQKKFIDEYMTCANATEAARRAGYKSPHVQGHQTLEKLRPYIAERSKQIEDERIADAIEINEFWTRIIRGDEKEEQGAYNPVTGKVETVQVAPAIKDRLKASEHRARVLGMFNDKLQLSGEVTIIDDI